MSGPFLVSSPLAPCSLQAIADSPLQFALTAYLIYHKTPADSVHGLTTMQTMA